MTDHICSDHLVCTLDHQPSVNRMLWELGHFGTADGEGFLLSPGPTYDQVAELPAKEQTVEDAVASWQRFRPELKEDGVFGEVSHFRSQEEIGCRCGCPDLMRRPGANLPRWGDPCFKGITTAFDPKGMNYDFGGKTPIEVWLEALGVINAACGATLLLVQFDDDPMISAIMGRMGGGTLAWSYLVTSGCSDRIRQEYNQAKTWGYHDGLWVDVHELGHALGIGHTSVKGQVMNPYYSRSVSRLGKWDLDQYISRYGKPADVPPVPPTPPIPGPDVFPFDFAIQGNIAILLDEKGKPKAKWDMVPRAKA